ncbi:MAG: tryptophan synthase subunit alpha [bacterium]|nr:tryptophan synthase subunit alpha [bacterium]
MTRIEEAFYDKKAFISFVTAGDPSLEVTKQLVIRMEQEGADLIELGIPFSDPVAEGPVIQAANERALKAGTTTDKIFAMVKEIRKTVKVPLVFLTYYNPIFTYGVERFLKNCKECGIDGVIVPDLPFEEKRELSDVCKEYGVAFISLIAPTSHDRIKMIAKEAEGFIYCVSSLGVTGVRAKLASDIENMVSLVRQTTNVPCAVGFGIATKEQAMDMASISDGAIVGSAIVELVAKHKEAAVDYVGEYVHQMKQAVESLEEVQEEIAK